MAPQTVRLRSTLTAPDRLQALDVLCGFPRCGVLGALWCEHATAPDEHDLWSLMLDARYIESAPGVWRRAKRPPRRPRSTSVPTGSVRVSRDREGHLHMIGPGIGTDYLVCMYEGAVRDRSGARRRESQHVGPIGPGCEPVLVCPNGHPSRLTAEHLAKEVKRLSDENAARHAAREAFLAQSI
jgi:hypothetical protein